MRQILKQSIQVRGSNFTVFQLFLRVIVGASLGGNAGATSVAPKSSAVSRNRPLATSEKVLTSKTIPDLDFLEQAEDVEREACWIITKKRLSSERSPFRVFRGYPLRKRPAERLNCAYADLQPGRQLPGVRHP